MIDILQTTNFQLKTFFQPVGTLVMAGKRAVYIRYILFLSVRSERKSIKKKGTAAQNGLSLTAFANDGAANSLRSDAACSRHRQTPYPVFDRSARS